MHGSTLSSLCVLYTLDDMYSPTQLFNRYRAVTHKKLFDNCFPQIHLLTYKRSDVTASVVAKHAQMTTITLVHNYVLRVKYWSTGRANLLTENYKEDLHVLFADG